MRPISHCLKVRPAVNKLLLSRRFHVSIPPGQHRSYGVCSGSPMHRTLAVNGEVGSRWGLKCNSSSTTYPAVVPGSTSARYGRKAAGQWIRTASAPALPEHCHRHPVRLPHCRDQSRRRKIGPQLKCRTAGVERNIRCRRNLILKRAVLRIARNAYNLPLRRAFVIRSEMQSDRIPPFQELPHKRLIDHRARRPAPYIRTAQRTPHSALTSFALSSRWSAG
jgi:hypothetical protein